MPSPFASTRFRGTWRPYQARVLGELSAHLADGRVHLVAPPGSGKTLLGLETVVRLGRPALVLAPTLALRDQWLQRFADFDGDASRSRRLEAPAALTVSTYQALHTAARADYAALLAALRAGEIGTLVVDEAHHLRQAWWRTLRALRSDLGGPTTVALTATPPYDVPAAEWDRYEAFCGPPDADISIPELVQAGHLCPHLDLVRYVLPAPDEQARLDAFRDDTRSVIAGVLRGGPWTDALQQHAWIRDPEAHLDAIVDDGPEWFVAALAVLREATDLALDAHAAALGLRADEIPALRTSLLDRFLTGALADHAGAFERAFGSDAPIQELRRQLDRLGALDGSQVRLQHPPSVRSALAASASKLDGAVACVETEARGRGEALRAVVLADRIREAAWDPERGEAVLRQLGVVPLFERLRARGLDPPLGVLTGRVVVLPEGAVGALRAACADAGLGEPTVEALAVAPGFVRVSAAGEASLAQPVTALFEAGVVRVLVGTVALLGEGWDAPSANVLVSASAAATFVRTGQLRGRVFRTDGRQPGKVSSVWHLASVDLSEADGGPDVRRLRRRFQAFAVPRPGDAPGERPRLETGLPLPPASAQALREHNAAADRRAVDLDATRALWREAVGERADGQALRPATRIGTRALPVGVRVARVGWHRPSLPVASLVASGVASGVSGLALGVASVAGASLGVAGLALVAWGAAAAARAAILRARRADTLGPDGLAADAAAGAVLDALRQLAIVVDGEATVRTTRASGGLEIRLDGRVADDAEVFARALGDLFGTVRSPRYLLRVPGGACVPVPDVLGTHKAKAEAFAAAWRTHVGPGTLVFTRTPSGARALTAARARAVGDARDVERIRRWDASR